MSNAAVERKCSSSQVFNQRNPRHCSPSRLQHHCRRRALRYAEMLLLNTTYELSDGKGITVDAKRSRFAEVLFLQGSTAFGHQCFDVPHVHVHSPRTVSRRTAHTPDTCRETCPAVPLGTGAVYLSEPSSANFSGKLNMPQLGGHVTTGSLIFNFPGWCCRSVVRFITSDWLAWRARKA